MRRGPWDRIKILVGLAGIFGFLALARAGQEYIPFGAALQEVARGAWWLLALGAVEVTRQLYYVALDHSSALRARAEARALERSRRKPRLSDWTRYRFGRYAKWGVVLFAVDYTVASVLHVPLTEGLYQLPGLIISALPMILQLGAIMVIAVAQFVLIFAFMARGGYETHFPGDVKTRFSDIWGQDQVLNRVRESMVFLEDPESIEKHGGYVPGGILLWGPPGCGKTLMAEAIAGETGKPFMFIEPGAFNAMFVGIGALKVRTVFKKLRKYAVRYGGVVAFFDEADVLGSRGQNIGQGGWDRMTSCNGAAYLSPAARATLDIGEDVPSESGSHRDGFIMGGGGGAGSGVLQAILTEMSGLQKPRGVWNRWGRRALGMKPKPPPRYRILIMMASNMPSALDEALLRPGRLDRIFKVSYPSLAGRIRTYEGYFAKIPHELTSEQIHKIATMTPYATGASIKDIVNEALINALREDREVATWEDVIHAKHLKDLGPPEDTEYVERERHAIAVHEACHAVVGYLERKHLVIDLATIEKGGTYLGMVSSISPEDTFTRWKSDFEADIMSGLASLAGERMFFEGDNTSGVSGDLMSATRVASYMEGWWGMGSTLSVHGALKQFGITGGGKPGDDKEDKPDPALGERIEGTLRTLYAKTEDILGANRAAVLRVAHALEVKKTLSGEDVAAVIDMRQGPQIDGRVYASREAREALHEYHMAAAEARRTHGSSTIPLPSLESLSVAA